jgi:acyl carrier protein
MADGMESDAILAAIRKSAVEMIKSDPAKVTLAAAWEDFGADQFGVFGIVRNPERSCEIEIPSDDLFEMETVGDLVAFVENACK